MALLAYSVRRAIGALLVILLVIGVLQYAVSQAVSTASLYAMTPHEADFLAQFVRYEEIWDRFPRDVGIGIAAIAAIGLTWRLAGTRLKRAVRADKVR